MIIAVNIFCLYCKHPVSRSTITVQGGQGPVFSNIHWLGLVLSLKSSFCSVVSGMAGECGQASWGCGWRFSSDAFSVVPHCLLGGGRCCILHKHLALGELFTAFSSLTLRINLTRMPIGRLLSGTVLVWLPPCLGLFQAKRRGYFEQPFPVNLNLDNFLEKSPFSVTKSSLLPWFGGRLMSLFLHLALPV